MKATGRSTYWLKPLTNKENDQSIGFWLETIKPLVLRPIEWTGQPNWLKPYIINLSVGRQTLPLDRPKMHLLLRRLSNDWFLH